MQAIIGLTEIVEEITCGECGNTLVVEYDGIEGRQIQCRRCGARINLSWDADVSQEN
jgi:DNA-directed RNA polymerase subunit RPC12/RpoP